MTTTYNMTDYAFKNLKAVGTIAAGATSLVLRSNPGFSVGDHIIIETGTEDGGGVRGTIGVGGVWPALSYATIAAMTADTGQANPTSAWVKSTGDTYHWDGSTWTAYSAAAATWYWSKALPLAHKTTITAISGTTLTLNDAVVAGANGANVYFDNAPLLTTMFAASSTFFGGVPTVTNAVINFPEGNFAFGSLLKIFNLNTWTFQGAGQTKTILFSPKGATCFSMAFQTVTNVIVNDIGIQGNCKQVGFGLTLPAGAGLIVLGSVYPEGWPFNDSTNGTYNRCTATDVFLSAFGGNRSTNISAYNCNVVCNEIHQAYTQWQYEWADCTGGVVQDCTFTAPGAVAAWETFRSDGTQFVRPISYNGTFSINGAGTWLVDSPVITMSPGSANIGYVYNQPIININANISPVASTLSQGGMVKNPTVIQMGAADNYGHVYTGISVTVECTSVTIQGTYPDGSEDDGLLGYIQIPDSTDQDDPAPHAITIKSAGSVVDGIRVNANPIVDRYFGILSLIVNDLGIVRNCVADKITGATQSGNRTNAEYLGTQAASLSAAEKTTMAAELATMFADNMHGNITAATFRQFATDLMNDLT